MADFVCPECGSVDHMNGLVVPYPYQCPGCDRVTDSAPPVEPIDGSSQAASRRVRVVPLRTEQWARPARRMASRRRPSQWGFPFLAAAVAGACLFVWLSFPDPPPDYHPAATHESSAPSSSASSKTARAADREMPAEHSAGATERATPDASGEAGPVHFDPEPEAFPLQPDAVPAPAGGRDFRAGRGLTTATPLFAGVPILSRPSWSGRQIRALSSPDPLLIVDNPPYREWVRVIDVYSGNEGWVRKDEVRISAALQ